MPEQFYDVASYAARDSIGYLIRRLTTIFTARIESAFESHQFTLTQWGVLMHLRDGLATTASDLACAFQHDTGALTRLLDQLERRGLIVRHRSARDRRVVELALTPGGHAAIATLLPLVVEQMNQALAPLTRAEFNQFRGSLVKVLGHLAAERPPRTADTPEAATPAAAPRRRPRPAKRRAARPAAARRSRQR